MLQTFFKLALAGALTASVSLADDFLAKVSKGALSDNSVGVKKLTADEANKVVGGYLVGFKVVGKDEIMAYAAPSWATELGLWYEDGQLYFLNREGLLQLGGMCGIDVTECYSSKTSLQHSYASQRRLIEIMSIVGNDPYNDYLGYTVRRHIGVNRKGERFLYFSYGVAVINRPTGSWYRFKSSNVLNNYTVIKEISGKYKAEMENILSK